jgi:hypothetical protein
MLPGERSVQPVQPSPTQSNFLHVQSNLVQLEAMDVGAGGLRGSMSAWKETWEKWEWAWEGMGKQLLAHGS